MIPAPTPQQLRELRKDNKAWPTALRLIPQSEWPTGAIQAQAKVLSKIKQVWRSRHFLLTVWEDHGWTRLSVIRTECDTERGSWREHISWDDLQRLKLESGFGDKWAVECYPPPADVINVANMRHLWIFNEPIGPWVKSEAATPEHFPKLEI